MFDKLFSKLRGSTAFDQPIVSHWPQRWIVLDTETTGLSLWRDHLLSIAAVAVVCEPGFKRGHIVLADRFEAILLQDKPTHRKSNILIHHIGVQAQHQGEQADQVLTRFASWVGTAPIFAFHAPFDKAMIAKALKHCGLPEMTNLWLDVAAMARAANRDSVSASLDDRLTEFGLQCFARHEASADMFVTAELLLQLLPLLREQVDDMPAMARLCAQHSAPP